MLKRTSKRALALLALVPFPALFSATAFAETPSNSDLDQRLKVLERQLENQTEEAAARAKEAPVVTSGDKGFSLKSTKGDYELKLRAVVQADGRFFLNDQNTFKDQFLLRRLRPTFEGSVGKLLGFRLTPEFAGDGTGLAASIVDAYIDVKFHPAASLRAGKQKGPVGLERLQSGASINFIERGYPTELVPNRDIGVALYGEVLKGTLTYTAGLFNGTADGRDINATDADNRHEFEGRVFAEPFKNEFGFFRGLGVGIGGTTGSQFTTLTTANNALPRYRSPGQNQFFSYINGGQANNTALANGTHNRISPQFYFYRNSFGILGEYVVSQQEVALNGVTDKFSNDAWQVVASYVLTGEDASYRGVTRPRQPYAVKDKGWGAFELLARIEELSVDDSAFIKGFANISQSAKKAQSYGVGVNWYLTANAKAVLDYNQTQFDGGAANNTDRRDEKAVFTRLQLTY